MKKILILSYHFPPCTITSSERIYSWAKYFKSFGYYPVIVTRNWDLKVKGYADLFRSSGDRILVEQHEDYEVHYLPYRETFKQKLYERKDNKLIKLIYKLYSLLFIFIEPGLLLSLYDFYKQLYRYASNQLRENKDMGHVLVTGGPFMMFKIGWLLKKKYRNRTFIADYKDDWTTSEVFGKEDKAVALALKVQRPFEKKWLRGYDFFTAVSAHHVEKISRLIRKEGFVIENGFMKENYTGPSATPSSEVFTITYVGTIYPLQDIEVFIKGIILLIDQNPDFKIKVRFVAILGQEGQLKRVQALIKGYEAYFDLLPSMSKAECINVQQASHMLLLIAHKGLKGTPGSKMYEYIALRKPVFVCPSDHDIIESSLSYSGQGIFADSVEECCEQLKSCYLFFRDTGTVPVNIREEGVMRFERQTLVKRLAQIIDEH